AANHRVIADARRRPRRRRTTLPRGIANMASAEQANETENQAPPAAMESGAYEIIRNRLQQHGKELRSRLESLNEARKDVFGAIETRLLGTERVTTAHNCVPRDLVAVGSNFLFGYNVHLGLKTEMKPADVFAVY